MSKIVSAVNAMIINSNKISNVLVGQGGEYFFLYDGKYKWSMIKRDDDTLLWFYPSKHSLETLAAYENHDWDELPMVTYRTSEIGAREARESFNELYTLLKEKMYGIDEMLEEIINDADNEIPF